MLLGVLDHELAGRSEHVTALSRRGVGARPTHVLTASDGVFAATNLHTELVERLRERRRADERV
jgi:hypothetical protein